MPIRASSVFQDRATGTSKRSANTIKVSPLLLQAADSDTDGVFQLLETSEQGLSETEAQNRLGKFGPNLVTQERQHTWIALLAKASSTRSSFCSSCWLQSHSPPKISVPVP